MLRMDTFNSSDDWRLPPLYSSWNAKGVYNSMHFAVKLRPDVHRALGAHPAGIHAAGSVPIDQVDAFSTYLHETVHWWQHVGSTAGLALSLLYPAQAHICHQYLKRTLEELGPVASLRKYDMSDPLPAGADTGARLEITKALNYWHDIEFYRRLVVDPQQFKPDDPYFECVGHCYQIALGAVLWLLSSTLDPQLTSFPDPRKWEEEVRALRRHEVEGFYYGSPIQLPSVGARQVFEGQARFAQLQYLSAVNSHRLELKEYEAAGYLKGVYGEAFELFLQTARLDRPTRVNDAAVSLFLLICDLAINPAEVLITPMESMTLSVESHDIGWRFMRLSIAVGGQQSEALAALKDLTAAEYWTASEWLCSRAGLLGPTTLRKRVAEWSETSWARRLLAEDDTFQFSPENLPVRVFFARFMRLQIDKGVAPEFFCWPGAWMVDSPTISRQLERSDRLFQDHSALFLSKEDGDIYPRVLPGRSEAAIQATFDDFYSWVALYELTRQWLVADAGFDFDFLWLTSKYSRSEVEQWASRMFEQVYGVSPNAFRKVA
jgi:hypothetical protein